MSPSVVGVGPRGGYVVCVGVAEGASKSYGYNVQSSGAKSTKDASSAAGVAAAVNFGAAMLYDEAGIVTAPVN